METLLLIIVLFAVHLAVLFSIALVISGFTSLLAIAGLGGRTALNKRNGASDDKPSVLPRILGVLGVIGAILTTLTLAAPLFLGERFVQPYLDGLRKQGGPDVTLEDASLNIAGGKARSDGLRVRQDDGAYIYDIEVDTVLARVSPIDALGGEPRIQVLTVDGVRGWLAPGYGGDPVTSTGEDERSFRLDRLELKDIEIEWRPDYEKDAVGSLTIESWETENIDEAYTLLDVLGRTNARGTFLDGDLEITHAKQNSTHISGWRIQNMSLSKAGAAVGGPMKFVKEGRFSLDGRSEWDDTLQSPATFAIDANLDAVNFGPKDDDDSVGGQLMGALSDAVARSVPEGARSLSFSFQFDISPETLQNAKSLYEFDIWQEIEEQLRQALLKEVGLGH